MALGGKGYFADGYFHLGYYHTDYWSNGDAVGSATATATMFLASGLDSVLSPVLDDIFI